MSIATKYAVIESSRNKIRDALIKLGLASKTDKLAKLATAIEGIPNQGAVYATVKEGDTYTIPAGYHNGNGAITGVPGSGSGGYNLQAKTVTPTKEQQILTPDSGYYGLSRVTVEPIPDNYQDVTDPGSGGVHNGIYATLKPGPTLYGISPQIAVALKPSPTLYAIIPQIAVASVTNNYTALQPATTSYVNIVVMEAN